MSSSTPLVDDSVTGAVIHTGDPAVGGKPLRRGGDSDDETESAALIAAAAAGRSATPPWRSIFSSRAVWAIIIAHTSSNFSFYLLLTCLPVR